MKKSNRLYNVIFPVFFLMIFPQIWAFAIPANYLIDRIVFSLSLKAENIEDRKAIAHKHTWKICIAGFISDLIGGAALTGVCMLVGSQNWLAQQLDHIAWNPYQNIISVLVLILGVVLAGIMIFLIDRRIIRKIQGISEECAYRCALKLALFTAPYAFLIPTYLLYR